MPLLHYKSIIKAKNADSRLTLQVCHSLLVGKDLATKACLDESSSYQLKKFLPTSIDVFSHSDLLLDISVMVNKHGLPEECTKQSVIVQHLVQSLRRNASVLGINNISDAYIDQTDGRVKVNVTPTQSVPQETSKLQLSLISVSLSYHCKTSPIYSSGNPNLGFSLELLNQVLSNLMSNHFRRRYPLIFCPLAEKLEHEKPYIRSIARSLLSMARRSTNDEFRKQVRRYIRILRRRLREYYIRVIDGIRERIEHLPELDNSLIEEDYRDEVSDENVICEALRRLYRLVLRPSFVRTVPLSEGAIGTSDDNYQSRTLSPCLLFDEDDEHEDSIDEGDAMFSSELKDASTSSIETSWAFTSRPPNRIGIGTKSSSGSEDKFLHALSVAHCAEKARISYSQIEDPDRAPQRTGTEPAITGNTQDCPDLYDSDSESFTITLLEKDGSSTLGSDCDLDSKATASTFCSSDHGPGELGIVASASRARNGDSGREKNKLLHSASPDQASPRAFSSCTGIALQPAPFRLSDGDQELDFDYDDFTPSLRSAVYEDGPITASTGQPHTNGTNLLYAGVLSGSVPVADTPVASIPFAIAIDEDTNNPSLDYSDEGEGDEYSIWGQRTRGQTFPISHTSRYSHTPGLVPRDALVTSPLENVEESDDQLYYPEGIALSGEFGSPELDGVFDIAMEYDGEHYGDLELEGEDDVDEMYPGPVLQCSSNSGRIEEVEMNRILDTDEEDGECRPWNLVE